ncbi:RGG repeats nuclear RNA binding protein A-like [Impatiens glandulifera]|uniref:RGG repeats nuclear RNA binding protein A-like n=1 Tax=Impatiens glandulifera TaxID=253017 RepID=UPI001FB0A863|nr:RGG repeats nuclear RNA binding protein A-like [Impatiens glandulifera]
MATINPFYLLDGDDNEDPTQLIAAQLKFESAPKKAPAVLPVKAATLPTKPLPPAQAVREARNGGGPRGGGRGGAGGRGFGRRGGFSNDSVSNENSFNGPPRGGFRASEDGESGKPYERRVGYGGPRGGAAAGGRGGRRDYENGDAVEGGERPRRNYERRSGTGRGNEVKREGSGRGNWGSPTEEVAPETEEVVNEVVEKNVEAEKPSDQEQSGDAANKENAEKEAEEKQPEPEEDKEMTLEEYEKVREEKRKALLALKSEERKVQVDNEFATMQLLSGKKTEAEIFVKLGSEKEKRIKDAAEKEERAKKSVSINEFLKPAEGEAYYVRGRGRGGRRGGGRGGAGGGYGGGNRWDSAEMAAPSIDETNFPSLGGK